MTSISVFTTLDVSAHIKHPNCSGAFYSIGDHVLLSDTSLVCVGWNLAQALPKMSFRIFECTARIKLYSTALENNPINNCDIPIVQCQVFPLRYSDLYLQHYITIACVAEASRRLLSIIVSYLSSVSEGN